MNQSHDNHSNDLYKLGRRLFLAGVIVSAAGCQNMIQRGQSPDPGSFKSKYSTKKIEGTRYIRDVCGIYGLDYKKIHGIGLAVDLNGTGSAPIESGQRKHLVTELKKNRNVKDIESLMKSEDTELVIIEGKLPPGIRSGETFDLEVVTMKASEATSLEGGMILQTELRPMAQLGKGLRRGNISGLARGRILTNSLFDSRKDSESKIHGVILGGGKAMEDRSIGLRIQSDEFDQTTTTRISKAINLRFLHDADLGRDGVARPKDDRTIQLHVPENYRKNIGRYVSVIHYMAFIESAADRKQRLVELSQQMSDPSQAGLAALKLEGLGTDGVQILKKALTHQDLEVRFRAAEALAYSGKTDGIDALYEAAKTEPAFRWHSFAALASLTDTSATSTLKKLLHVQSAETRYGAFQSLMAQAPSDPIVNGRWLGSDFYLHQVASDAPPMIHFSRLKRPEIVVFGDDQIFEDHFLFVEPGLSVKANGNQTVSIKRYSTEFGDEVETCSNRVAEVIELLGELGVGYAQQLNMLREAKQANALEGRLVVNATPKLGRTKTVPGKDEPAPEKSDRYLAAPLPEMFRTYSNSSKVTSDVVGSSVAKSNADAKMKAEPEPAKAVSKWKQWFIRSE